LRSGCSASMAMIPSRTSRLSSTTKIETLFATANPLPETGSAVSESGWRLETSARRRDRRDEGSMRLNDGVEQLLRARNKGLPPPLLNLLLRKPRRLQLPIHLDRLHRRLERPQRQQRTPRPRLGDVAT